MRLQARDAGSVGAFSNERKVIGSPCVLMICYSASVQPTPCAVSTAAGGRG